LIDGLGFAQLRCGACKFNVPASAPNRCARLRNKLSHHHKTDFAALSASVASLFPQPRRRERSVG
jgi:hypothetical protein